MRILVVGGTRFFGAEVVRLLLNEDHEVVVLSRGRRRPDFWKYVRHIQIDRDDDEKLKEKISKEHFDVVLDNIVFNRHHVETLLDALYERIGHYVLVSSIAVYHANNYFKVIEEDDVDLAYIPEGYFPGSNNDWDYAIGKRDAELALWKGNWSCPFTIIRPAGVEGPNDHTGFSWFWIQRIADGKPVLLPRSSWTPMFRHIFSEDIARVIVSCLNNPRTFNKAYNVAGEEILTVFEYIQLIGSIIFGNEVEVVEEPYVSIRRQPGLNKFEAPYIERRIQDIRRIKQDLGFYSTPILEWLEKSVYWHLDNLNYDSSMYANRFYEIKACEKLRH